MPTNKKTDYLVTVKKYKCKVESIVWTNQANDVKQYSDAERLENLLK